jgi:hypothetical protein
MYALLSCARGGSDYKPFEKEKNLKYDLNRCGILDLALSHPSRHGTARVFDFVFFSWQYLLFNNTHITIHTKCSQTVLGHGQVCLMILISKKFKNTSQATQASKHSQRTANVHKVQRVKPTHFTPAHTFQKTF